MSVLLSFKIFVNILLLRIEQFLFYFILFYFIQSVLHIYISSIYFILFYFIQSVLYIYISTIYFILFYSICTLYLYFNYLFYFIPSLLHIYILTIYFILFYFYFYISLNIFLIKILFCKLNKFYN